MLHPRDYLRMFESTYEYTTHGEIEENIITKIITDTVTRKTNKKYAVNTCKVMCVCLDIYVYTHIYLYMRGAVGGRDEGVSKKIRIYIHIHEYICARFCVCICVNIVRVETPSSHSHTRVHKRRGRVRRVNWRENVRERNMYRKTVRG